MGKHQKKKNIIDMDTIAFFLPLTKYQIFCGLHPAKITFRVLLTARDFSMIFKMT